MTKMTMMIIGLSMRNSCCLEVDTSVLLPLASTQSLHSTADTTVMSSIISTVDNH